MKRAMGLMCAAFLSTATGSAVASPSNVQFSAETVQSAPNKETRQGLIYVGDNQVRVEYQKDSQTLVEIYDMKNQRALLLMPQQTTYMERKVPRGETVNPMLPPSESNPCAAMPKAQCRQLATESLYGRSVTKWEMTMTHEGESLRSLHWIDDQRHMPLREEWPDGTVSELLLLGQENLNGRATERWQRKSTRADGESMQTTQWYDPELQIAIREELPGGYFRELRNIRVGPQPGSLFQIPAGYRLVTPQQQQPAGQSGAPQGREQYPARQYPGR